MVAMYRRTDLGIHVVMVNACQVAWCCMWVWLMVCSLWAEWPQNARPCDAWYNIPVSNLDPVHMRSHLDFSSTSFFINIGSICCWLNPSPHPDNQIDSSHSCIVISLLSAKLPTCSAVSDLSLRPDNFGSPGTIKSSQYSQYSSHPLFLAADVFLWAFLPS